MAQRQKVRRSCCNSRGAVVSHYGEMTMREYKACMAFGAIFVPFVTYFLPRIILFCGEGVWVW